MMKATTTEMIAIASMRPTEISVLTNSVFFASGFWHGSTAPFIIWGLLQAVYRVGEELLHRRFGKPKKRGTPARVLWGKRVVVFVLWKAVGTLLGFEESGCCLVSCGFGPGAVVSGSWSWVC